VSKWVGEIAKVDQPRRVVYGYAYKAIDADGNVLLDHSQEFIDDAQGLEDAVVDYVLNSREGDVMHMGDPTSVLVESMVITPEKAAAMGVADGALPQLAWWVGYKILDDTVWEKVQKGELAMFSIAGTAEVEEVEEVE